MLGTIENNVSINFVKSPTKKELEELEDKQFSPGGPLNHLASLRRVNEMSSTLDHVLRAQDFDSYCDERECNECFFDGYPHQNNGCNISFDTLRHFLNK